MPVQSTRERTEPSEYGGSLSPRACKHCGTVFLPKAPSEHYCCHGCAAVAHLLKEQDLEHFYHLQDRNIPPVGERFYRQPEYAELKQAVKEAEREATQQPQREAVLRIHIEGLSCTACVWLIEYLFHQQAGAKGIQIDLQYGEAELRWEPEAFDLAEFAQKTQRLGYLLSRVDTESTQPNRESRRVAYRLGFCAAFSMNTMLATFPRYFGLDINTQFAELLNLLALTFATLSMLVGGAYFIQRAWTSFRAKLVHMDAPIALGLLCAYGGSLMGWLLGREDLVYFDFVSFFVFFMLLGRWLQESVIEHNRHRNLNQYRIAPTVECWQEREWTSKPMTAINDGDHLRINAGAMMPVAGYLYSPRATLSYQSINGEQDAVTVERDERIPSGAVNCTNQQLEMIAQEKWQDSLLCRLLSFQAKDRNNAFLDHILRRYIVLIFGVALMGGGFWAWHGSAVDALQVTLSVLVVSCPCAIGVALPLLDECLLLRARQQGITIRSSDIWHRLKSIRHVVFDKTGTLTTERPGLLNPEGLDALSSDDLHKLNELVDRSLHPLARSLQNALKDKYPHQPLHRATSVSPSVKEIPGSGLILEEKSSRWSLGKPGWQCDPGEQVDLVFERDGDILATFRFDEKEREHAQTSLSKLQKLGYQLHLLSGDRPEKVKRIAECYGFSQHQSHAGMSPEAKADWIKNQQNAGSVLMVGDGLNDSLALQQANCSAAVVTDLNLVGQHTDVLLTNTPLQGTRDLLSIGATRNRAMATLFGINVIYNIVVIIIALAGHMNPLVAAIVMPLSSIVSTALVAPLSR